MKKKLCSIICLCSFVSIMLFACGKNINLIEMSTAENDEYMAIIWQDRTYVPFCTISENDCGTQIGYLNGVTDDRICEYKDYPTDEWIANYLTVDGGAILFKEVNVTHIPEGLESEYEWNIKNEDWIPMVMADDVLYLDTGYEKEAGKRPDTFEGVINSEVDRREKPTVNDQSNFGTGYGYRYGKTEGIIEIYVNDKWQVFATEKIIASDTLILDEQLAEQAETSKMWDRIPLVRVNGKLYYDTGRESIISGRCGNMDGEITSTVDGTEIPTEDNQSNFGSGFGYQYGAGDTIEIYMNEKWFVFEYREESE